jgi:hypothetical protein
LVGIYEDSDKKGAGKYGNCLISETLVVVNRSAHDRVPVQHLIELNPNNFFLDAPQDIGTQTVSVRTPF